MQNEEDSMKEKEKEIRGIGKGKVLHKFIIFIIKREEKSQGVKRSLFCTIQVQVQFKMKKIYKYSQMWSLQ